jgi:hypothetical protein
MRDWHLGQRGRSAAPSDRSDVCESGNRLPPVNQVRANRVGSDVRAVIAAVCLLDAMNADQFCSLPDIE